MRVKDLKPGILLKPRKGFAWYRQKTLTGKPLCLTVRVCESGFCEEDVAIYVGERDPSSATYGKQMVFWRGENISVNPSAWRVIEIVQEGSKDA